MAGLSERDSRKPVSRSRGRTVLVVAWVIFGTASRVAGATATSTDRIVEVYHSDFGQPDLRYVRKSLKGLDSGGELSSSKLKITVGGESLTQAVSGGCWEAPAGLKKNPICLLAAQAYSSGSQALSFFEKAGFKRRRVLVLDIQSKDMSSGDRVADAGMDDVRIRPFPESEMASARKRLHDVILHEVTHTFQDLRDGEVKALGDHATGSRRVIERTRIGQSLTEGYANFFAYLMTGRTRLGKQTSAGSEMTVFSERVFGQTSGSQVYQASEPLTSVLVSFHQNWIQDLKSLPEKEQATTKMARVLLEAYRSVPDGAYFSDYFVHLASLLRKSAAGESTSSIGSKEKLEKAIERMNQELKNRGLEMDPSKSERLVCGIKLNGQPIDMSPAIFEKSVRVDHALKAQIEVRSDNSCKKLEWPIVVRVLSLDGQPDLGACVEQEGKKLTFVPKDPGARSKLLESLEKKCQEALGSGAARVGALSIKPARGSLTRAESKIELEGQVVGKCKAEIEWVPVQLLDSQNRELTAVEVPFACSPSP